MVGACLIGLVFTHTAPAYVTAVERDVVYSTAKGYWCSAPVGVKGTTAKLIPQLAKMRPLELKMDIYKPEQDGSGPRPLLLMMHGGSFFVGHKEEKGQAGWCEYFASLGYVAVSINYRLGFLPTRGGLAEAEDRALEDADAALRYLLDRKDLRIDPDYIFAAGTSAGAMLALRLAFRPAGDHPHIRAVANCWGSVHDLAVLELSNTAILSFQSPTDPVMPYGRGYPFHTGEHGFWPPTQWFSEAMYGTKAVHDRAVELGLRAEHHPCPETGHRLHIGPDGNFTPRFYEIRDSMVAFFAKEFGEESPN